MPIRCKLISPFQLEPEHPIVGFVHGSEFVVLGAKEFQNTKWDCVFVGALAGAIFATCVALFLFSLFMPKAAGAQALPAGHSLGGSRWLATAEIGSASGLGYRLPDSVFGLGFERPFYMWAPSRAHTRENGRWEAQGALNWSPDNKYVTGNGNQAQIAGKAMFWPIRRLALSAGDGFTRLWTSQFNKSSWTPTAGIVVRDRWFGLPGRAYFDYLFPTGCQWATAANPCVIQSNRTHGVKWYQEFRIYPHVRFGIRGSVLTFADQGNQNQPMPRTWHTTGTIDIVLRYEFRAGSLDEAY